MTEDPIATRTYRLGADHKVKVEIYRPVEIDEVHWQCNYTIHWPDQKKDWCAAGIDSMQALILAIHQVGIEIYSSDTVKRGDLVWHEPGGGFGLPLPKNCVDMYQGDDPPI